MRQEDAKYVLNIRPSALNRPDTCIWCYSKKGDYNVKSGYYLQRQLSGLASQPQHKTCTLPSEVMKRCCTRLWKLNIPPKIKTFWWRALQNGLPVATNMKIRVPKIDHICQTCGEMDEIVDHVLFQCRVTKEIWSMVPSLFQSQLTEQTTFLQNVDILLDLVNKDNRNILNFIVGWKIWKMRNKLIFGHQREHIIQVIHVAIRDYNQWKEAVNHDEKNVSLKRMKQVQIS